MHHVVVSLPRVSAPPEPFLVRVGVRYFQTLSRAAAPVTAGDAIHFLNPEERRALKRIQRGAVIRAAVAGGLSTVAAAIAEVLAHPLLGPEPDHATVEQQVHFWAIVGSVTVVASVIEIAYLYWDGLRAVHRLAAEAGLDLFPETDDDDRALAGAMARAALELPNPTAQLFGVNPWREASRVRLFVASIVYKLKVSVSNFAIKALIRRMLGRAFVRTWLPFVAVPITALWNAAVCWLIMREARIRAMGPSAAQEMIDVAFESSRGGELSATAKAAAVRAVASAIVRTEDMHPNLVAVLGEVVERTGIAKRRDARASLEAPDGAGALDDSRVFLELMPRLSADEQCLVLRVLAVASIIDGRLTRNEKRLLVEAHARCGKSPDLKAVDALRRAFLAGDPIERVQITRL